MSPRAESDAERREAINRKHENCRVLPCDVCFLRCILSEAEGEIKRLRANLDEMLSIVGNQPTVYTSGRAEKKMDTHSLERTSPKGGPFIGYCTKCGKVDLPAGAINEECPNPSGITQEQSILDAVEAARLRAPSADADAMEDARAALRRGARSGRPIPACACFDECRPSRNCNGVCEEAAEHVAAALLARERAAAEEMREKAAQKAYERYKYCDTRADNEKRAGFVNASKMWNACAIEASRIEASIRSLPATPERTETKP